MDTSSIAGSSLLMRTAQTQQALSTTMMKQAATQQTQVANMLAQNVRQAPQPAANNGGGSGFSTYA
jgi:phosphopantetheine adenylyltransferase